MKEFDIAEYGIEFKNLISGPAPVGRILNYIYIAGKDQLRHKNGYRSTDLANSIGCAWTTELMIGLNIFTLGCPISDSFILNLTDDGSSLYNLIKHTDGNFNEGSNALSISNLRSEVDKIENLYTTYKSIFIKSFPFKILREYLLDNGFYYPDRTTFMDNYFSTIKEIYDLSPTGSVYNSNVRTSTAKNRVPSLLQLCQFFDLLEEHDGTLSFKTKEITNASSDIVQTAYTQKELQDQASEDEQVLNEINNLDLVNRFGIDGTVLISSIVRNSSVQKMFKHNLMLSQGGKCILCGIKNPTLLIGSHIKPASESNVYEKIDQNNGLLLCCNHDKLFDKYLITFNFIDGQIEISKTLSDEERIELKLDPDYCLPGELLTPERQQYLMEHNEVFQSKELDR